MRVSTASIDARVPTAAGITASGRPVAAVFSAGVTRLRGGCFAGRRETMRERAWSGGCEPSTPVEHVVELTRTDTFPGRQKAGSGKEWLQVAATGEHQH